MKKVALIGAVGLGVYIAIGLLFDALVGYYQPQNETTLVIQTRDDQGLLIDTVLTARDHEDELWVESGHWFRGWFRRLLKNPEVYIIRNGKRTAYRAEYVDTEEAIELMTRLMGKGQGMRYWIGRTLLLYAPIKPVYLEPGDDSF